MNIDISLKQLLEVGSHFGHQARRWNPRMKQYLFAKRDGLHVFDLVKTKEGLEEACRVMYDASKNNKRILMVATKRQAQDIVKDHAIRLGLGYVTERWLGGMLTNFDQMKGSFKKMKKTKKEQESGLLGKFTKKEVLMLNRNFGKNEKYLGGLMMHDQLPEIMYVVDTRREAVAISEARALGIKIVGLVDSNCDPANIDVVIPANDDAVKSIAYITGKICEAIAMGKEDAKISNQDSDKK